MQLSFYASLLIYISPGFMSAVMEILVQNKFIFVLSCSNAKCALANASFVEWEEARLNLRQMQW